ncbi:hypothetical protein G5B40_04605 [Pikeienuella piscinae]|uniref:Uncharacterized protein n=1 Tax=Pikeienuella piscinae TaxID=2748098 RepID=A0A7L5BX18_9RHOB|nr:hypothetical protein [Pikeienuella piscinae]QIE54786.1 hypothetical protein G5B40_04605 [Pikeienuella piscinae]
MFRAMLFALLISTSATPAAGDGLDAWLNAVAAAERDFDASCDALRATQPPQGLVWLRLGPKGVEFVPADESAAAAAAFWAEAALGAEAAAKALYGRATGEGLEADPVMIETGPEGVAVHDGAALRRGDPCDALRRMVPALGGAGASMGGDPFDTARADAASRIPLAIGAAAVAPLEGAPAAGAFARGPDGITAEISANEDGGAFVALKASRDASPGEATLRIYDPGDRFHPVETIDLSILPGAAPAPADAMGALSPGGSIEGALSLGEVARIPVEIAETERIRFASRPGTDIAATLETADGRIVAADDDAGGGYGFAFSAELQPGRYFLSVSHCCGGGGAYAVTAKPN